jgi:hypothetical protein
VSRVRVTFDERGEVTEYVLAPSDDDCRQGWQAMMLAPTLEVCRALLADEKVPLSQLDPKWTARFGLRS